MPIRVLSQQTIDEIAAGEVVERPASVVKELVENAIDAGATAVSVETKGGGVELIRVTDNGSGIPSAEVPTAFQPHATSKIRSITDLESLQSLGFRGEALPSIAAVSDTEVLTKTADEATGTSFRIRGGKPGETEEIGVPNGTTFLVRDLFYNTPARRAFLKTPVTEASFIGDLLEKIAFSHPEIAFKWINDGKVRLDTPGNGNLKALIYTLYGRETANELVEIDFADDFLKIRGFLGKPVLSKGNRSFELYFVNGRFVRNKILEKAIEDAYQPFMMQHRYPFLAVEFTLDPAEFDVNVHPSKLEIRFRKDGRVYDTVYDAIRKALSQKEFIPESEGESKEVKETAEFSAPEPFETNYRTEVKEPAPVPRVKEAEGLRPFKPELFEKRREEEQEERAAAPKTGFPFSLKIPGFDAGEEVKPVPPAPQAEPPVKLPEEPVQKPVQTSFIDRLEQKKYRLVGEVFDTYWILEMDDAMYLMDQHAAHEKVLYEAKMKDLRAKAVSSQLLTPPAILHLSEREVAVLQKHQDYFTRFGYEIRLFGGRDAAVTAVPADLYGLDVAEFFREALGDLVDHPERTKDPELLLTKLATMSCKAAVKGNDPLTFEEAEALLDKLLTLENPYACPHGRPTLVRFSKTDLEKKFKRIVS